MSDYEDYAREEMETALSVFSVSHLLEKLSTYNKIINDNDIMPKRLDDLYHSFFKQQDFNELKLSVEGNHKLLIDRLSKEERKTSSATDYGCTFDDLQLPKQGKLGRGVRTKFRAMCVVQDFVRTPLSQALFRDLGLEWSLRQN